MNKDLLTIKKYDESERQSIISTPNRIIECVTTQTMAKIGYPVRVSNICELNKYVDCMHEGRFDVTFDNYIHHLTIYEFELIKEVTETIINNSKNNYGVKKIATSSLIRALIIYRMIKHTGVKKDEGILEIGAGNGYLGLLLSADGYRYISTDICQAFYLYQNHIMSTLLGKDKILECANHKGKLEDLNNYLFIHIPWWKFYINSSFLLNLKFKYVITCHMLAEMHINSFKYILTFLKKFLTDSCGSFLFEGWGSTVEREIFEVNKLFSDYGYVMQHNHPYGTLYTPNENNIKNVLDYSKTKVSNLDSLNEIREKFHPQIFLNQTKISKLICKNETEYKAEQVVNKEDLKEFFKKQYDGKSYLNDDENFLNYIGVKI